MPAEPPEDLLPSIGELLAGRQARRLARNVMVVRAANPGGMTIPGLADFLECSHNRLDRVLPVLREAGRVAKHGRVWTAAP